ncbi:hypothetical protein M1146_06530, partial [Patescibacteria group bacterium]|nr:hypothetical protein [Patescibacteria group bacterium]MCL4419720.1 hypothetical protein [Patescibacteria group bacterium]
QHGVRTLSSSSRSFSGGKSNMALAKRWGSGSGTFTAGCAGWEGLVYTTAGWCWATAGEEGGEERP